MNLPARAQLLTRDAATRKGLTLGPVHGPVNARNPLVNTPYGADNGPFTSPLGVSCTSPSYASMTAVDLASGRVVWTKPFGTAADTGPLGIHSHLPVTMGVPFSGGGITTRGGLAFIAASVERGYAPSTWRRAESCGRRLCPRAARRRR